MLQQILQNQQVIFSAQILCAVLFGGLIGFQREMQGKWAGPRTHALVCAGSSLFTILSLNIFAPYTAVVASAIVSGIGFLGLGTIIHKDNRAVGLTTAAGIWISAAVGMAIAANQYIVAIATTIFVLLILSFNDSGFLKK